MSQTMLVMTAAIGAELVLLVIVALGVAVMRQRAARQRDQQALRKLVARIRQEKPQREQAIEEFLGSRIGLSGEALQAAKVALQRAEIGLLQRFVGIYRQREAAAAARFDSEVYAALDPYHELIVDGGARDGAGEEGGEPADSAQLEFLERENKRLEDELRITMETMSRMLNEYSTMFAGDQADDDAAAAAGQSTGAAAVLTGSAAAVSEAMPEAAVVVQATPGEVAEGLPESPPGAAATGPDPAADMEVSVESPDPDEAVSAAAGADAVPEPEAAAEELADEQSSLLTELPAADSSATPEPPPEPLPDQPPDVQPQAIDRVHSGDAAAAASGAEAPEPTPQADEADDPLAEIMREAKTREQMARASGASTGDEDEVLVEAAPEPDKATLPAIEKGVAMSNADIDDDLFDAVEVAVDDDPQPRGAAAEDLAGPLEADLFDPAIEPVKSRSEG